MCHGTILLHCYTNCAAVALCVSSTHGCGATVVSPK